MWLYFDPTLSHTGFFKISPYYMELYTIYKDKLINYKHYDNRIKEKLNINYIV